MDASPVTELESVSGCMDEDNVGDVYDVGLIVVAQFTCGLCERCEDLVRWCFVLLVSWYFLLLLSSGLFPASQNV